MFRSQHRQSGFCGKVIGVSKVARDITERKRAEEARQLSEARYRALFDYAPDGIVIADPESYYIDVNSSMCRMLGYTREEFIGLHASDIVVQSEDPGNRGQALDVIKSKSDYQREWNFRRKDGSVFQRGRDCDHDAGRQPVGDDPRHHRAKIGSAANSRTGGLAGKGARCDLGA